MRVYRCIFVTLLLSFLMAWPVLAAEPFQKVMLPMSDGVKLATDIYLPGKEGGAWPVILMRSTYGRGLNPKDYLGQHYAVVIQDVRGMGESEGEKHVFYAEGWRPEVHDGADTAAWIKQQSWCNGKIGTEGGSALAMTQMLMGPSTRDVAGQMMIAVPSSFYGNGMYQGGVFMKSLLEEWLKMIQQPHLVAVYKSHPLYDEYWRYFDANANVGAITAPGLFFNGWYDIFQQGTLDGFVSRELNGGPGAKGNNYLVMTWGCHGPDNETDYKFSKGRHSVDIGRIGKAFFKRFLKGDPHAMDGIPKVQYYVMGADTPKAPGNEWRSAEQWPPAPTRATSYYLHGDGTLSVEAPTVPSAALGFTFDPKDPYPTHGGANLTIAMGPLDQRVHSGTRKDLLKFSTAPLESPLEITGRVLVKLYVSSDAPDTDFTAKLVDIYPSGDDREILMLDNIRRVKTRLGFDRFAPLLTGPSEVVEVDIDLWSISWIFAPGHRIGLHISSSNFPRYEINPNTGADFPVENGELRVAHNQVHLDAVRSSALILPIPLVP